MSYGLRLSARPRVRPAPRPTLIAVLAAVLLALSGCGVPHMGVAARFGEQTLTNQQLEQMVNDPYLQQLASAISCGQPQSCVLNVFNQTATMEGFAQELGLAVDEQFINSQKEEFDAGASQALGFDEGYATSQPAQRFVGWLMRNAGAVAVVTDYLQQAVMQNPSNQQQVQEEFLQRLISYQSQNLRINPRWGELDPDTQQIMPAEGAGLSTANPPTPTPLPGVTPLPSYPDLQFDQAPMPQNGAAPQGDSAPQSDSAPQGG